MAVQFGPFSLDETTRQLSRAKEPLRLSPKAFDLLAFLLRERPAAISKARIHQRLWPDTFVTDGNVAVLVTEIRHALGDDGHRQEYIRTVPRFGYAFTAAAIELDGERHLAAAEVSCWLAWDVRRLPLLAGENVIGRDPSLALRIDAMGVSRRHAMIVVEEHRVTLDDLASKNGTFADDVRVTAPVALSDGMEIRFGPVAVRFRQSAGSGSTQTYLPRTSQGTIQ